MLLLTVHAGPLPCAEHRVPADDHIADSAGQHRAEQGGCGRGGRPQQREGDDGASLLRPGQWRLQLAAPGERHKAGEQASCTVCAPECERHAWVLGRLGTAQGGFGPNCCRFLNSTSPHREVICRYTRPCLGTGSQQSERKHTSVRVRHAWALGRCCGSLMHRAMPTDCSCACLGQAAEQVSNEVYDV